MEAYTALALSQAAVTTWTQHMIVEKAEPFLARFRSKSDVTVTLEEEDSVQEDQSTPPTSSEPQQTQESSDHALRTHLAQSLVSELSSQVLLSQARQAEAAYVVVKSTPPEPLPPRGEAIETHILSASEGYAKSVVQELLSQLLQSVESEAEAESDSVEGACPVESMLDKPGADADVDSTTDEPHPPLDEATEVQVHSEEYAESMVQEMLSQLLNSVVSRAETKSVELGSKEGVYPYPADTNLELPEEAIRANIVDVEVDSTLDKPHPLQDEAIAVHTDSERYVAESMVQELLSQQSYSRACELEARSVELTSRKGVCPPDTILEDSRVDTEQVNVEPDFTQPLPSHSKAIDVPTQPLPPHSEAIDVPTQSERRIAESMVQELLSQQMYSTACKAETRFVELSSHEGVCSTEGKQDEQVAPLTSATSILDSLLTSFNRSSLVAVSDAATNTENDVTSTGTCTEPKLLKDVEVCTEPRPLKDEGTSMEPRLLKEVGCNTFVNCLDVLRRAKEIEELNMLKADHLVNVKQLNEEKSKRMVAEQLVKIVQSDLSDLRQRNVSEVTTRMRLENELGDAKVELSYANKQLEEKEERIKQLEESLTGSSLLVRKLEEQNSISLMNRGGIDYMVQAKLAEGRAREAEQKLEVVQSELLQAQTEVRVLLDRVSEAAREKTESVSSKVHTQLLQLADEKAMDAERRAQDLEREVRTLREQLSSRESSAASGPYGTSYGSTFPSLTGYSSYLTQPSLGSPSLYPSASVGATYSKPELSSYGSPSYLLPSSLKSHDYLGKSHDPVGSRAAEPRSHDFLGKSYEPLSSASTTLPASHDILKTKTHDFLNTSSTTQPKSHDYRELSHDIKPKPATPPPREVELPLVSSIPERSALTDKPSHVTEKEDSSSSDWSSSDDEEGSGDPLLPSSHRTLISQWEWRTMNKETPTSSQNVPTFTPSQTAPVPTPSQAVPTDGISKKRPPPIAPKPKHFVTPHHQSTFEPPSSFNEPARAPTLVSTRRVKGPQGRRLPVRFSKHVDVFA